MPECRDISRGAFWFVLRRTLWCLGNWVGGKCCLASRCFRWAQWGRATASCTYLHFTAFVIPAVSEFWTSLGIVYWKNRQPFFFFFPEMDAFPHRLTRLWFLLIFILTCLQPPFNFQTCVKLSLSSRPPLIFFTVAGSCPLKFSGYHFNKNSGKRRS